MRIPVKHIPADIMEQYALAPLIVNHRVMVEIRKGVYMLSLVGLLVQKRLNAHLLNFRYYKCEHTPRLYAYKSRKTTFALVIHDFGIKYMRKEDALYLLTCVCALYEITSDWTGSMHIVFTLK